MTWRMAPLPNGRGAGLAQEVGADRRVIASGHRCDTSAAAALVNRDHIIDARKLPGRTVVHARSARSAIEPKELHGIGLQGSRPQVVRSQGMVPAGKSVSFGRGESSSRRTRRLSWSFSRENVTEFTACLPRSARCSSMPSVTSIICVSLDRTDTMHLPSIAGTILLLRPREPTVRVGAGPSHGDRADRYEGRRSLCRFGKLGCSASVRVQGVDRSGRVRACCCVRVARDRGRWQRAHDPADHRRRRRCAEIR